MKNLTICLLLLSVLCAFVYVSDAINVEPQPEDAPDMQKYGRRGRRASLNEPENEPEHETKKSLATTVVQSVSMIALSSFVAAKIVW